MQFRENRPIYIQIADYILDNIITEKFKVEDRIASVREMASDVEVNPNTVARTYMILSDMKVIYNQRGIGYFISKNAKQLAMDYRREIFIRNEVPDFFDKMDLLNLDFNQIQNLYRNEKKSFKK